MKKFFIVLLLLIGGISLLADVWVNGYTRKDGTYVQGHWRSSPNSTTLDNYSTKGNINPYTGKKGYKDPYGYRGYGKKKSNSLFGSSFNDPFK